jgi:hypothetical protein
MTDITIPPAALEAGARALARYNCEQWDNDPDRWRAYFTDEARAAFLAMIEAWPNRVTVKDDGRRQTYIIPAIILPLPTEASDE